MLTFPHQHIEYRNVRWSFTCSPLHMQTAALLIQSMPVSDKALQSGKAIETSSVYIEACSVQLLKNSTGKMTCYPSAVVMQTDPSLSFESRKAKFVPQGGWAKPVQVVHDSLAYCEYAGVQPQPALLDGEIGISKHLFWGRIDSSERETIEEWDGRMCLIRVDNPKQPNQPAWCILQNRNNELVSIPEEDVIWISFAQFLSFHPYLEPFLAVPDGTMIFINNREIEYIHDINSKPLPLPIPKRYFGYLALSALGPEHDSALDPLVLPEILQIGNLIRQTPYFWYCQTWFAVELCTKEFLDLLTRHNVQHTILEQVVGVNPKPGKSYKGPAFDPVYSYPYDEPQIFYRIEIPHQDLWRLEKQVTESKPVEGHPLKINVADYRLFIHSSILEDIAITFGREAMFTPWVYYPEEVLADLKLNHIAPNIQNV